MPVVISDLAGCFASGDQSEAIQERTEGLRHTNFSATWRHRRGGCGIGDPGGEEVIGGKQRLLAGPLKDYGDRWGGIESLGGGQQGSLIGGTIHGRLDNDNLYPELY